MADRSRIEWTDATWNPVRGCSRVSEGCRFCYAETIAARFSGDGQPFCGFAERDRAGSKWTGRVDVIWPIIDLPLGWHKPRRIFVNSMSDLFHPAIVTDELASIYAVMVAAVHLRGHTMQVLTKRPDHMRATLASEKFWDWVNAEASMHVLERTNPLARCSDDARATLKQYGPSKPPPGIWLGVSAEDQRAADERIPELLATPAAIRFVSCEPLLGPVDLGAFLVGRPRLDWVIAGGESGPGARPMHPDWARLLRDQCVAAGVPFFFKQWGEWAPGENCGDPMRRSEDIATWFNNRWDFGRMTPGESADLHCDDEPDLYRVGKGRSGALLDGREHREIPA